MKRLKLMLFFCVNVVLTNNAVFAEGLPANPWQNPQRINAYAEENGADLASQASATAVDVWSKVRNSEEFRQWNINEQEKTSTDNDEISDLKKQAQMISMLANLNRVGYEVPRNYRNVVKKMPRKVDSADKYSYEKALREWKNKYYKAKNSSLNILDNSYRRVLSTIKNTTGIDVNRNINEAIKAFK